jgi:hypothetical protein
MSRQGRTVLFGGPTGDTPMIRLRFIATAFCFVSCVGLLLCLPGCDEKVTKAAASQAGKTLQKFGQQLRVK